VTLPGGNNGHQIQLGKDSADFVSAYAHAYCDGLGPCCAQYSTTFDVTVCRAAATQAIADAALLAAGPNFETPQLNSELIPHCLEVAAQVGAKCSTDPAVVPVNDACGQVFSPKGKPGEPCVASLGGAPQCAPNPGGVGQTSCGPDGLCYAVLPVSLGQPCKLAPVNFVSTDCEPDQGLQCLGNVCSDGTEGMPCSVDDQCQEGLVCSAAFTCVAGVKEGAPCVQPGDDECGVGYLCTDSKTCAATGKDGGPCASNKDCPPEDLCDFNHPAVCVPRPGLGAACREGECAPGLYCKCDDTSCLTSHCAEVVKFGASCDGVDNDALCGTGLCWPTSGGGAKALGDYRCIPPGFPLYCWTRNSK
jgi:hypothetical protein